MTYTFNYETRGCHRIDYHIININASTEEEAVQMFLEEFKRDKSEKRGKGIHATRQVDGDELIVATFKFEHTPFMGGFGSYISNLSEASDINNWEFPYKKTRILKFKQDCFHALMRGEETLNKSLSDLVKRYEDLGTDDIKMSTHYLAIQEAIGILKRAL